jgi:eukaryotic-like serine/threonine-protein kinase
MGGTERAGLIRGRYELLEVAGEGGMATVWRGLMHGAAGYSRPVAVKRLLPLLLRKPEFVEMFVEEARMNSALLHTNIVQILDFDEDEDGSYFLVMEWVEGLDLKRYLATYSDVGRRTAWPLMTAIAVETLRGLSAAHERIDSTGRRSPVIHRDVTPQNVLLGTNGNVKLTDFGLARAVDRSRITNPTVVKGKLAYLAPELTEPGGTPSERSDIYSLGVVLWEALAGRGLFQGHTDVSVFLKAKAAEVPQLTRFRDDLPEGLVAAISCALARRPEDRFPSAREFLRALVQILRGVSHSTDAYAIGHSVIEARCFMGKPPPGIQLPPTAKRARAAHPARPAPLGTIPRVTPPAPPGGEPTPASPVRAAGPPPPPRPMSARPRPKHKPAAPRPKTLSDSELLDLMTMKKDEDEEK